MAQMKYEKVPPQETFSDCMAQFISILSTLMGKLIGLGYFEHYRRMDIILHNIPLPMDIRDLEGPQAYQLRWVTDIFINLHDLLLMHESLGTGIYLAALKDAARLLDKVCSLCVNNNVIFFMATFAEFLPPSIMPLAMAHSGKPMHELRDQALLDDSSKP